MKGRGTCKGKLKIKRRAISTSKTLLELLTETIKSFFKEALSLICRELNLRLNKAVEQVLQFKWQTLKTILLQVLLKEGGEVKVEVIDLYQKATSITPQEDEGLDYFLLRMRFKCTFYLFHLYNLSNINFINSER